MEIAFSTLKYIFFIFFTFLIFIFLLFNFPEDIHSKRHFKKAPFEINYRTWVVFIWLWHFYGYQNATFASFVSVATRSFWIHFSWINKNKIRHPRVSVAIGWKNRVKFYWTKSKRKLAFIQIGYRLQAKWTNGFCYIFVITLMSFQWI